MTTGRAWRQLPAPVAPTRTAVGNPIAVVVAWAASAFPLAAQLDRLMYLPALRTTVVIALGVAIAVAAVRPRWALALAAGVAFAALRADERVRPGTLVVIVVVAGAWAVATGAARVRRGTTHPLRHLPALVALVVVDWALLERNGLRTAAIALGVAVVAIVVTELAVPPDGGGVTAATARRRPWTGLVAGQRRLMERVGVPLGRIVGAIAMVPTAVVTTLVWASHRLVRFDVLAPPAPAGSRWTSRRSPDLDPSRAFATVTVDEPRGAARTLHRVTAGVPAFAAVVLVALLVAPVGSSGSDDGDGGAGGGRGTATPSICTSQPDAAMDGQPGWPQVGCDTTEFSTNGRFDAATSYAFDDFTSQTVNQVDGRRVTWTPPACECRRIRIWWFGGSAGWGWYQRDEHTIPSELARLAWEDGVALDIVNFAVPGWVLGQEARQFAELTASDEPLPEVAVFYDGGNDLNRQLERNNQGHGSDESETSFAEDQMDAVLANGPFSWNLEPEDLDRRWGEEPPLSPRDVATHAMNRYLRSMDLARLHTASVGVTPIFVWQPLAPGAPDRASNDDVATPDVRDVWEPMLDVADDRRPAEVIDLSDSLDEVDRPVFKDIWHTSELGARTVAESLWERLAPRLRSVTP